VSASLVLAARLLGSSGHSGVTDSGTFPADSRRSCLQQGQLPQTRWPCRLWPFQGFAAWDTGSPGSSTALSLQPVHGTARATRAARFSPRPLLR